LDKKVFSNRNTSEFENKILQIISNTDKTAILSSEVKNLKNKMEAAFYKIQDIDIKIDTLSGYVRLLKDEMHNEEAKNLVERQKAVIKYLSGYFDSYSALFIDILMQIKIELFNKDNKAKINVKDYIAELKKDTEDAVSLLKKFLSYSKVSHTETDKSIEKMETAITAIKTHLITYQSEMMLSNMSPIEDEYKLKTISAYNEIIVMADNLDNQYERFMQEKNIVSNN